MFPIQARLLTPNKYSRPQTKLKGVKGIVIHWTANEGKGADAEANRRYFENRKSGRTGFGSAHYIVDSTEIVQCLPDTELAYHVGATKYKTTRFGSYPNNCTLGIEMCVNADGDFKVVYEQTIELAALLAKKYNLNPETDIVRHFDVTGKNCPAYFTSKHWGVTNNSYAIKYGVGSNADSAWKVFLSEVKVMMTPKPATPVAPKPAPKPVPKPGEIGFAEILVETLNVRKSSDFDSPVIKKAKKGEKYAVYKTANGLHDIGDGWISAGSAYTKFTPKPKPVKKPVVKKVKYPLPTGVYRLGDKGAAVKQIQVALNAAYFKCGTPDGVFGKMTEDALKRFQSVHANPVDGVYGPLTRASLHKKVN